MLEEPPSAPAAASLEAVTCQEVILTLVVLMIDVFVVWKKKTQLD